VPIVKVADFPAEWREWWNTLQPSWRSGDLGQDCPPDADWQVLQCGGNNGIFIVVMCLSWWGKAIISPQNCLDFQAAVEEVAWVLEKISTSVPSKLVGSKRVADDSDVASSNKRAKR
jgi:hypothetical protein